MNWAENGELDRIQSCCVIFLAFFARSFANDIAHCTKLPLREDHPFQPCLMTDQCVFMPNLKGKKNPKKLSMCSFYGPKLIQGLKLLHKVGGQSCDRPGEGGCIAGVLHTRGIRHSNGSGRSLTAGKKMQALFLQDFLLIHLGVILQFSTGKTCFPQRNQASHPFLSMRALPQKLMWESHSP